MCASFVEILVLKNKAKYALGHFSSVGRCVKSNYLLIDKVTTPLAQTIEFAFTNRPAKLMQYLQGSKKRNGGCNRNLNAETAKETMLSGMRVSG